MCRVSRQRKNFEAYTLQEMRQMTVSAAKHAVHAARPGIYSIQVQPPRPQTFFGTDFGTDGPMKRGPQALAPYNSKFDVCLCVCLCVFVFVHRVLLQRPYFRAIAWREAYTSQFLLCREARYRLFDWFVFGVVSLSTSLRFFCFSMV